MTANLARDILWPTDTNVAIRVAFLYVGQGSSTVVLVKDGAGYRVLLIDSNLDERNGGINVPKLIRDLASNGLYAFVNTHPHDDHLKGVKQISEAVTIENVWHSGHVPSKKYGTYHKDLAKLIRDVEKRNGASAIREIIDSPSPESLFKSEIHFLAPAEPVKDDVNGEDAEKRYRRIHENCAVLKIGKGDSHVLITGDAELVAFRDHIVKTHKSHLRATVLAGPHHGSRDFFMDKEGDEPYLDALKAIDPSYVVISAPTVKESPHEHPNEDAVEIYADHVGKENVLHTGKNRETFYFDISTDGTLTGPHTDDGDLSRQYGFDTDDGDDGGSFNRSDEPGQYPRKTYAADHVSSDLVARRLLW